VARDRQKTTNETLGDSRDLVVRLPVVDLVDVATDAPVLRLYGQHIEGNAGTNVTLTGHGPPHFPVRGLRESALMSAVDASAERLLDYRLVRSKRKGPFDFCGWAEIVVSPTALTFRHIELVIAVSRPLMSNHFKIEPRGSGL
jgi:hypothetical protein